VFFDTCSRTIEHLKRQQFQRSVDIDGARHHRWRAALACIIRARYARCLHAELHVFESRRAVLNHAPQVRHFLRLKRRRARRAFAAARCLTRLGGRWRDPGDSGVVNDSITFSGITYLCYPYQACSITHVTYGLRTG